MSKQSKILIIDDVEANRYAFSRFLQKVGYSTEEAGTVTKGLELIESYKPDLVILDVQLPDGNGFDVCLQLKSDPESASLPVLMTSASFVAAKDRALGLDCGAEGYLTTPIDSIELIATVKALLRIKEVEQKLHLAVKKAETANIAKTEFLANMSHEIRTPMNAIIGLTRILATTPLTTKQQQYVATLVESGESLMALINDMLDITKIEDNKIELESIAFSLFEISERVANMMQMSANKKGLKLVCTKAEPMPDKFLGDPQRLYQVILNLVNNALKFTESGGVTIAHEMLPNGHVQIQVIDTGIGIAPDKQKLIFNKFTQADSSTTRKYGGSGLGLTIAKKLIEQMEGTIHVTSTLNTGSTFTIEVPLKEAPMSANVKPIKIVENSGSLEHGPGKILLVEDHKPNVLIATIYLDAFGYQYEVVSNGVEALEKLKKERFDVVLMDVQMHEMDGYETTRQLRQWEKEKGLKPMHVIAMTAHVMAGDREKCLAAGMDDYLSKPISEIELERKLARLFALEAA